MNRFVTSSIATGLAAITIAGTVLSGPVLARSLGHEGYFKEHPDTEATDMLAGPATGSGGYRTWHIAGIASDTAAIDRQIRHLPAGRFNVVGLDATARDSQSSSFMLRKNEPGYLAGLQRAIESNHPLVARLEARNVEIRNVVGAEPGGNGSMTFYVQ
jgi:hypothetical protein